RLESQLSLAVPPWERNAARLPGHDGTFVMHCTLKLGGQLITGGMVSTKVIVWLHEERLVQSSVAVHVRRKTRTAGQLACNSVSRKVMSRLVSQLSMAVGFAKTGAAPVTHSLV